MLNIQLDQAAFTASLHRLQQHTQTIRPALQEIGEQLTESTKQRFADQTDPDGNRWQQNKAATLAKKGAKPALTGETGVLMDSIHWQLAGAGVEIGSPMAYAAMQQFGGKKAEFAFLWGDIPARPFLGVSDDDEAQILAILSAHKQQALQG